METPLKIYIDRLKDGHEEEIKEEIDSKRFELDEPERTFSPSIALQGKAYLANDHIVVQLQLKWSVTLPCAICNQPVTLPRQLKDFYHTVAIEEIKNHILDLSDEIRETILLNTPDIAECNGGNCPKRQEIKKYFTKPDVQYPFSDLDS